MNTKILSRLGIFFIGIPLVVFLIWLKACNHLTAHLLIIVMTLGGSIELYDMLKRKTQLLPKPLVVSLSVFMPVATCLDSIIPYLLKTPSLAGSEVSSFAFILAVLLCLAVEVFGAKDFEASLEKLSSSIFVILYTGYLFTFVQRIIAFTVNGVSVTTEYMCLFVILVFMCDSMAWFFGMLLGRNNKGFIKASPNKSIAGFIGGFIGSIGGGIGIYFIWPELFGNSIPKIIILAVTIAASAIIGDLAESIFKRSAGVKDSGSIIPGRGGVLDSIDSILMCGPVFYLMASLLFKGVLDSSF